MSRRFKTGVVLESGLVIPTGAGAGRLLGSDASGNAAWIDGVLQSAVGGSISGANAFAGSTSYVYQQISATGMTELRDPRNAISGVTFTVPAGEGGLYRVAGWLQYVGAAASTDARMRVRKNGAASSDLVTVAEGAVASVSPSANGYVEMTLVAGDTISAEVAHRDTTSRTLNWRLAIDRMDPTTVAKTLAGYSGSITGAMTNGAANVVPAMTTLLPGYSANAVYNTTNGRIQPSVAGFYRVTASVNVAATAAGRMILSAYSQAGTELRRLVEIPAVSGQNVMPHGSFVHYYNGSTDWTELRVFNSAGASFSATATSWVQVESA